MKREFNRERILITFIVIAIFTIPCFVLVCFFPELNNEGNLTFRDRLLLVGILMISILSCTGIMLLSHEDNEKKQKKVKRRQEK